MSGDDDVEEGERDLVNACLMESIRVLFPFYHIVLLKLSVITFRHAVMIFRGPKVETYFWLRSTDRGVDR
jgi:hypothetical protein